MKYEWTKYDKEHFNSLLRSDDFSYDAQATIRRLSEKEKLHIAYKDGLYKGVVIAGVMYMMIIAIVTFLK